MSLAVPSPAALARCGGLRGLRQIVYRPLAGDYAAETVRRRASLARQQRFGISSGVLVCHQESFCARA